MLSNSLAATLVSRAISVDRALGSVPRAASDTAANTRLTVTIGTQCFTRTATVKID